MDRNGSDGWTLDWDTLLYPPEPYMILVVQALDGAGNSASTGMWNLFPYTEKNYIPITR